MVGVPSGACLYCHRQTDGFYHGRGYFKHLWDVAEHPCACSLAGHFFDRTSEVDVDHVGMGLLDNAGSLYHRVGVAPVDLDSGGAFGRFDGELAGGGGDIADQGVGRHEFCIGEVCSLLPAYEPERFVGDILHRGEEHRTRS